MRSAAVKWGEICEYEHFFREDAEYAWADADGLEKDGRTPIDIERLLLRDVCGCACVCVCQVFLVMVAYFSLLQLNICINQIKI